MRCSWRPSRVRTTGAGHRLVRMVAMLFVLSIGVASSAHAQSPSPSPSPTVTPTATPPPTPTATPTPTPTPTPSPTPSPSPTPNVINSNVSATATVTNLGSSFLERLGNQSTNGFNRMLRNNPGGGGASEATDAPRYRTWVVGYGISATNSAIGGLVGDNRETWGGAARIGARGAPGPHARV